jgi:hypothetical protein
MAVKPGRFAKGKKAAVIAAAEMKFMGRIAGYILTDYERNADIMKELDTKPVMNLIQTHGANWKRHVLRMPCSRIPFQIQLYQPKGKKDPLEESSSGGMSR